MEEYWIWISIAMVLLILEMFSLSFYLLIVSAAFLVTGLCNAVFHTGTEINMIIAAMMSLCGIAVVNQLRRRNKQYSGELTDEDDYDIGELVDIISITPDGFGQVRYRGAPWQAKLDDKNISDYNILSGTKAKIIKKEANLLVITLI